MKDLQKDIEGGAQVVWYEFFFKIEALLSAINETSGEVFDKVKSLITETRC